MPDHMDRTDTLAALVAQAMDQGADPLTVRALVEEACELGAQRALQHLGLSDLHAAKDISDLRQLLISWRDVNQTARRTAVRWMTTLLLTILALGAAFYTDVLGPRG
ncbi:MAG: DUF6127 family protein [Pseudomonadota bacterium]